MTDDFDALMQRITQLLRLCHDALAPTATERQRREVREALASWLHTTP